MSRATSVPSSGLRAFWRCWRFHISVFGVLVPLVFAPQYIRQTAIFRGEAGLGQREIGEFAVGPWTLRMAEQIELPPMKDGAAGYIKSFTMALCDGCRDEVKATYLKVGKVRSLRAAGYLFYGTRYRQVATIAVPETASPDDEIWLTQEGWNGEVHHAAIPIEKASPVTANWLRKRGGAS